jgi:hypothetical protein
MKHRSQLKSYFSGLRPQRLKVWVGQMGEWLVWAYLPLTDSDTKQLPATVNCTHVHTSQSNIV